MFRVPRRHLIRLLLFLSSLTFLLVVITWTQRLRTPETFKLPQQDEFWRVQHNGFNRIAHMGVKRANQSDRSNKFNNFHNPQLGGPKESQSFGKVGHFGEKNSDLYPVKGSNKVDAVHGDDSFQKALQDRDVVSKDNTSALVDGGIGYNPNESAVIKQSNGSNLRVQKGMDNVDHWNNSKIPYKLPYVSDNVKRPGLSDVFVNHQNLAPYPTKAKDIDVSERPQTPPTIEMDKVNVSVNQTPITQNEIKQLFTKMPVYEGENIISMTLYGDSPRYTMGAIRNAELAKENFPGWKLRVYTEAPSDNPRYGLVPQTVISKLRSLGADIQYLQPGEDYIPPMMWRFLVADDLWVTRFIVRDSDARLTERDAAVVSAWVKSGKPFNCVRDHPSHASYAISGGMWGGQPEELFKILRRSWRDMMRGVPSSYLQDMNFLNMFIWPKVQAHAYCSDSVSCDQYSGSHPFPVPRLGYEHVGQVVNEHELGRPADIKILRDAGENKKCVPDVDIRVLLKQMT